MLGVVLLPCHGVMNGPSDADILEVLDMYQCAPASSHTLSCTEGQVPSGVAPLFTSTVNSKDECEAKCGATPGCVGFDYTTMSRVDACRGSPTDLLNSEKRKKKRKTNVI